MKEKKKFWKEEERRKGGKVKEERKGRINLVPEHRGMKLWEGNWREEREISRPRLSIIFTSYVNYCSPVVFTV